MARLKVKSRSDHDVAHLHLLTNVPTKYQHPTPRNFMASILQVGVKSDFFKIERGCKKGDPIAPYLFIICAQILYYLINKNPDIKGINIGNKEFRLTQFADDTTLILDG